MKRVLLLVLPLVGSSLSKPFEDCPASGSVQRLGRSSGALDEAPSPAPSVAPLCTSQTSNARGQYTSTRAPCTFSFHSIQGEEEDRLIDLKTSDLCSDSNSFLVMKEYVNQWDDECVGDFARCYSLEHHRHLLMGFWCAMNWNIPNETTHISVNCMEDKLLVLEEAEKHEAEEAVAPESGHARLEQVELTLFNAGLVMVCCLVGIFVISKTIVKPLVAQSALRLDQGVQPHNNNHNNNNHRECPENCHCGHANGWISSQRLRLQIEDLEDLAADPIDDDDFDLQIPADFDAVPIVPATILPQYD